MTDYSYFETKLLFWSLLGNMKLCFVRTLRMMILVDNLNIVHFQLLFFYKLV